MYNAKVDLQCEKVLDTITNREIYTTVDTQASIIGGMSKLYSELGTIKIPKDPDLDQIKIYISFIVEPNGDIMALNTIGKINSTELDKKLFQLIKKYTWEPGKCKGVNVPTRLTLKVVS